jgi:streptogramin lyase
VTIRTEALAIGPHSLRVTLGVDQPEGVSEFRWLVPGSAEFEVVPTQALFNQDVGDRGFIARYFAGGAAGEPSLIARQVVLGPVDLLPPPYTAELIAEMNAPEGGTYGFALEANQETLVYIDGNLVLERGPAAGGRAELQLALEEGLHDILIRYSDPIGDAAWRFEWRPPSATEFSQPPLDAFTIPPGGIDALPVDPVLSAIEPDEAWGADGRTLDGLESPRGIAIGPGGDLFFLDEDGEVRVFNGNGAPLRDWDTGVSEPSDIAVGADGAVYVVGAPDRVLRFQPDGTPDGEFAGEFQAARGVDVSEAGRIYVAHASLSGIIVIEPDGTISNTIRPADAPDGTRYLQPTDVAVTPEAIIFSVTAEQASIWRLTPFGGYSLHWLFSPNVSNAGSHLAYESERVIATDPEGGRVLAYDPDGRLLASGQLPQGPDGQRARPVGVAAQGDVVWTADILTGRVFKLNVTQAEEG